MMKTIPILLIAIAGTINLIGNEIITISPDSDGSGTVTVKFHNTTKKEIVFMRTLDGSTIEAFQPHYTFTVKNASGAKTDVKILDCIPYGLWSDLKWPEDYLIRLTPSETHEAQINIPELNGREGLFEVTLKYEYKRENKEEIGFESVPYPSELWEGSIISNTIKVRKKN